MARIIALDIGGVRTGIAVSDSSCIIATALDTIPTKDIITFLRKYFDKESVEVIVVGMPKNLKNEATSNTPLVIKWCANLQSTFLDKKIVTVDERFTSSIALDTMIAGGMKKKDRRVKGNTDKISATLILQSYMEMRNIK